MLGTIWSAEDRAEGKKNLKAFCFMEHTFCVYVMEANKINT